MTISSRFFEAGSVFKLCSFTVEEGDNWSPPEGAVMVHSEPMIDESNIMYGMYIWALVPENSVFEDSYDSQ